MTYTQLCDIAQAKDWKVGITVSGRKLTDLVVETTSTHYTAHIDGLIDRAAGEIMQAIKGATPNG